MEKTFIRIVLTIIAFCAATVMSAQVTTSSINGKVEDSAGNPIPGTTIIAKHIPSGTSYYTIANNEGRFVINGMRTGGPYSVEVTSIGYQAATYTDIVLQLAEAYQLTVKLTEDNEMLQEVVIISQAMSKLPMENKGIATNISNDQITALPTISRSITDVTKLSPYGGNGMSFMGTDGRTANFTVDGANFNNNFGLSENLPGGGNPISLDAIEEVQVVISPYDVRQSNFIGGGVNAITKSGTNTFRGTAYAYHRNENMRGNAVAGEEIAGARDKDRYTTYGATLGGPIVKNKLFFFANFEYSKVPTVVNRWRASADGVADPENYISRVTIEDMQKVSDFLKEKYGYDTGSYTDYPADESNMKILARIDWNISDKHNLAVRYNYTIDKGWNNTNASSSNCGVRTNFSRFSEYSMAFANSMYSMDNIANTVSLDLNSRFSDNLSNQLLVTWSKLDSRRGSNSSKFPFIDILDGTGTSGEGAYTPVPYMSAGYELFTWNNGVHNTVITAKDDITYFTGNHKIIGGLSYEYQMADNSYMRNGTGYYRYKSLDDFLNGAEPETVALTYGYGGEENPAARVRYHKAAAYVQDDWDATDRFKLTAGLRIETIIFDNNDLMTNNAIKEIDYNGYHVDTGRWPKPKVQFSPRVGFVWDIIGDSSLKLRGGTGLFTGRLPLVFFTNMPTNAGMVQNVAVITTNSKGVADPLLKHFAGDMLVTTEDILKRLNQLDPKRFPMEITPEDGVVPSAVQAVDPNFKMPQVWKSSLALDYAFPTAFPMSLTGEFIYNKTVNGVRLQDIDIISPEGFASFNGDDNRHIYPSDFKYNGVSCYLLTNTNKGYGYSASVSFRMAPIEGLDFSAAYTHTVSKELTGMPGSNAESAFTYVPTVDGPNNATLHNSQYVTPDRAYASLTYSDRCNNHFSLFYETWRGGYNYTYMSSNDINGDGYNYDVLYIPTESEFENMRFVSDDDKARFWAFVNKDAYLSKVKGQYTEAYSVYSPWVHRLDFRYSHDFKVKIGNTTNTLQLSVDIKNILNLFNSSWGVSKYMAPELNSGRILKYEGLSSDGYPVYSTPAAVSGSTQTWIPSRSIGQCWYAQVGIKYLFN